MTKFDLTIMLIWDLSVLFIFSYVVFFLDRSPWWIAMAILLISASSIPNKK